MQRPSSSYHSEGKELGATRQSPPVSTRLLFVTKYIPGGIGIRRPAPGFRGKEAIIGIFWTLWHSGT